MKALTDSLQLVSRALPTGDLDGRLNHMAEVCARAAAGDLEARLSGFCDDTSLGPLAHSINHLLDVADAYVRESSAAMDQCSQGRYERPILCQGLAGSYRKAAITINRAALKMKTDAGRIAEFQIERERVVKEVTETTGSIAAACEELSATTNEISRQAGLSSELTSTAVSETDRTLSAMSALMKATQEIESVVTLISQIASQTKLLALNASIESARAGVHGACFNVVAQEVKNLSQGTSNAIENIATQVDLLRRSSTNVQSAIEGIGKFIHQIHGNTSSISTSVREQVEATTEISKRMEIVVSTMQGLGGSQRSA
jgi:methyl-accepting chemotaxis protein